ncbi:MAG: hypothetical protein RIS34_398 [Pseudomonadota bacterium]|jgi:hypothetical protein
MNPIVKTPLVSRTPTARTPDEHSASLPLPEVIEGDYATGWGMWHEAVSLQDGPARKVFADTMPSRLMPLSQSAELATEPAFLSEKTAEEKRQAAMAVLAQDHKRIHAAIGMMWGQRECSTYIQKLILNGGDGMGNGSDIFTMETLTALFLLSDLNDLLCA